MKRILVTGAAGQLGQDVCAECERRGLTPVGVDLPEVDIGDRAAVDALVETERPGAIVNCAAYNEVDKAEQNFKNALWVNAIGPRNLAVAAERAGVALIHFSTDFVFDGRNNEPYTIADEPAPLNRYGLSKLRGEAEVQGLTARHYVVRLSWVFGSGNDNFVRKVLAWAGNRKSIQVVEDQTSCPCYTAHLAPAVLDLLKSGAFGLYHLTNEGHCSRYEWAKTLLEMAGMDTEVEPVESSNFHTPAARPAFSAMDCWPIDLVIGRRLPHWREASRQFLQEIGAIG